MVGNVLVVTMVVCRMCRAWARTGTQGGKMVVEAPAGKAEGNKIVNTAGIGEILRCSEKAGKVQFLQVRISKQV